jgi:organic radical activating enzyme
MTLEMVRHLLREAQDLGTVDWIYLEGGEPFLYYPLMLAAVREAADIGFRVGAVSNGYWATTVEDAVEWLRPMAGKLDALSVSSDIYHWNERLSRQAQNARCAAEQLGMAIGVISIAQPEAVDAAGAVGQLPAGESTVMYRGRAVKTSRWATCAR